MAQKHPSLSGMYDDEDSNSTIAVVAKPVTNGPVSRKAYEPYPSIVAALIMFSMDKSAADLLEAVSRPALLRTTEQEALRQRFWRIADSLRRNGASWGAYGDYPDEHLLLALLSDHFRQACQNRAELLKVFAGEDGA